MGQIFRRGWETVAPAWKRAPEEAADAEARGSGESCSGSSAHQRRRLVHRGACEPCPAAPSWYRGDRSDCCATCVDIYRQLGREARERKLVEFAGSLGLP